MSKLPGSLALLKVSVAYCPAVIVPLVLLKVAVGATLLTVSPNDTCAVAFRLSVTVMVTVADWAGPSVVL